MRLHLLIVAAIGTVACSDTVGPDADVGPLWVRAGAVHYPAGATASLTLTNLARIRLDYTACFSRLERRTAGQWVVVYQDPSPCPAVLQYLDPGASKQVTVILPTALQPAAHRIRFPSIGVRQDGGFVNRDAGRRQLRCPALELLRHRGQGHPQVTRKSPGGGHSRRS